MRRGIMIIFTLMCLFPGLQSQEYSGYNQVDSVTYRLYMAMEWDSLITAGKTGLKQGIDYYYLRMRMGIAFYEKQNYRMAAMHFSKALSFNENDPLASEYLYYSRLFSGQQEQARMIRKNFQGDLALKLPPAANKIIDRFGAEYLNNQGLNDQIVEKYDDYFSGLSPGVQYLTRSFSNSGLSLTHCIAPGVSLSHSYTRLNKTNFYYYDDGFYRFAEPEQRVYQHQYYIAPRFTTLSGFVFIPAFHFMNIHYQTPVSIVTGDQGQPEASFEYKTVNDYVGGLGFSKDVGLFDLYLAGFYATLNHAEQIQNTLGLTWYPGGNLNFYAGGFLNSQYEKENREGIIRIVPEVLIGAGISGKVWIELNASAGDMSNYLEKNGYIVYNSFSDIIEKKIKINLTVPVNDQGSLIYLGGRWTASRSEYYAFDKTLSNTTNNISYHSLAFYGGISWKF